MQSDPLDESYFIDFKKIHSHYYTNFDDWARCTMETGCVEIPTSEAEYNALMQFFETFTGSQWRIRDNWQVGDPCLDHWYGVQCNVNGNIIALHFFENHLQGTFPDSIIDLVHLKHLSIFNGDTEFEGVTNQNANRITKFHQNIFALTELEEINLTKVNMGGKVLETATTGQTYHLTDLKKLKYLNLANNAMSSGLPDTEEWADFTQLEIVEIQNNDFFGNIPINWKYLPSLTYINLSYNRLSGSIPVLSSA